MINCLNWLGACENYSSIYNMRNWLASVDELIVKKQAAWGVAHIIFDNMDIYIKQLHHLTLPILMFELYPTFHLSNDDEKTLEETLKLFSRSLIDMNDSENISEKKHFLFVVETVLANEICSNVEGLQWISELYPKHHEHQHSKTASSRSAIHVEPPKPLDEKKIQDMTVLLDQFVNKYLTLLAERLPDDEKKQFLHDKKVVEEYSVSEIEMERAESNLMKTAKEFGFLILHGDLLRSGCSITQCNSTQINLT